MTTNTRWIAAQSHRHGFTLIEISVVIVILAIASALVVPQLGGRDDLKTKSAARIVMADLMYVQNRAVSTQQVHYVTFDVTHQSYSVSYSAVAFTAPLLSLASPVQLDNVSSNPQNKLQRQFGTGGDPGLEECSLGAVNIGNGAATIAFDESGTPYWYTGAASGSIAGSATIAIVKNNCTVTIRVDQDTGEISAQ